MKYPARLTEGRAADQREGTSTPILPVAQV